MESPATFSRRKKCRLNDEKCRVKTPKAERPTLTRASTGEGTETICHKGQSKRRKMTQMHLDIGQKKFHPAPCAICGFVFASGDPFEERLHSSHHKEALAEKIIRYRKIPNSMVLVANDKTNGKIYKLEYYLSKRNSVMDELAQYLERELGLVKGWLTKTSTISLLYLASHSNELQGCAILESNSVSAFPASRTKHQGEGVVVASKCCSPKRSSCAVRLIWTSKSARRTKIASKLLDCARAQVIPGQIIPRESIAFSQPTHSGSIFIKNYTKSDIFYVYE